MAKDTISNNLSSSNDITLMQWNLHISKDMNFRFNLKAQADVILQQNPDVVVLNEVDKNCARTGCVDMAGTLATLTGMCFYQFAGSAILPPEGLYGGAILSRFYMTLIGSWLIPSSIDETRSMTLVKICAPKMFLVALTHLTHRDTPEENDIRVAAVTRIDQLIKSNNPDNLPVVLAGDFNCYPDSNPVERLAQLGWTLEKPLPSFPSYEPNIMIDHFYRETSEKRFEVIERFGIDEKVASDHIPIVNKLRFI